MPRLLMSRRAFVALSAVLLMALPASAQPEGEPEAGGTENGVPELTPEPRAEPEPEPPATSFVRSADYELRLRELEDRVNDLKEEIFRSKSRLVLLREQVLRTSIGGSSAVITHINDLSSTFDLVQIIYSLDGNQILNEADDSGSLADLESIELYHGTILPGPHNLSVEMILVGNGFGLFSYLEGYRFRLRSSYAFTAEDGKIARVDIVAYEQGGINQPIEERPSVRYEIEFVDSVLVEE
jgi:hypothetical protein